MDSASRPAPVRTRAARASHVTGASGLGTEQRGAGSEERRQGTGERRRQAGGHREPGAEDDLQPGDVVVACRRRSGAGSRKPGFQRCGLRGARIQLGFCGGRLRRPFGRNRTAGTASTTPSPAAAMSAASTAVPPAEVRAGRVQRHDGIVRSCFQIGQVDCRIDVPVGRREVRGSRRARAGDERRGRCGHRHQFAHRQLVRGPRGITRQLKLHGGSGGSRGRSPAPCQSREPGIALRRRHGQDVQGSDRQIGKRHGDRRHPRARRCKNIGARQHARGRAEDARRKGGQSRLGLRSWGARPSARRSPAEHDEQPVRDRAAAARRTRNVEHGRRRVATADGIDRGAGPQRIAPDELMDALGQHQVGHRVHGVGETGELRVERDLRGIAELGQVSGAPRDGGASIEQQAARRWCDRPSRLRSAPTSASGSMKGSSVAACSARSS